MSVVTNLILTCSLWERDGRDESGNPDDMSPALLALRDWCNGVGREPDRDHMRFPDKQVDTVSAGTKHMECNMYAWGANYLDLDAFLAFLVELPWRPYSRVQLFVREQNDDEFSLYTMRDRKWHVLSPDTIWS